MSPVAAGMLSIVGTLSTLGGGAAVVGVPVGLGGGLAGSTRGGGAAGGSESFASSIEIFVGSYSRMGTLGPGQAMMSAIPPTPRVSTNSTTSPVNQPLLRVLSAPVFST